MRAANASNQSRASYLMIARHPRESGERHDYRT